MNTSRWSILCVALLMPCPSLAGNGSLDVDAVARQVRLGDPRIEPSGEADVRTPFPQARELYQALKDAGAPVRFISYPGEGHHFRQAEHLRHLMKEMQAWLKNRL